MTRSFHPILSGGNGHKATSGSPKLPRVVLLKEQHWSFLQKRYRMTLREIQIAKKICTGYSNEEIADALHIKPGTVKTHLRNIYRKTWVRNKISMLLRFVEDSDIITSTSTS